MGVQLRNSATVGGSVYARFGFSDILTCLMALDTYVELHHEGVVPLAEFAARPVSRDDRDILVRIIIRKDGRKAAYTTPVSYTHLDVYKRQVTAREMSLEEIRRIRDEVDVEIESFVHGALCYCYSGQCLMSSLIGGRSGNRGRCAQPCRLPYEVRELSLIHI